MKSKDDLPDRIDIIARILCLAMGLAWSVGAGFAYSGSPRSMLGVWLLVTAALIFFVAATFGPRWFRTVLVSWVPWL
ncbi:MAG: hypothetical protein QM719_00795 [Thermomonas sp.]